MYFLLNLSHCVKGYGHFCQILAFFMMLAYQIWSCHVIQDADFENVLFCPNSIFNVRKSHKISSEKALYFRSYQLKTSRRGGKHPPLQCLYSRLCICFRYEKDRQKRKLRSVSFDVHVFISATARKRKCTKPCD